MDFFAWQARKQRVDQGTTQPKPDTIEFDAPQRESIEVQELTASTTIIQRLYETIGKRRG